MAQNSRQRRDDVRAQVRDDPDPGRRRDSEATREALLDAAMIEFAAKGMAGARVGDIAARAGVNSQLISYYFGGKDGLYDAILRRWHEREAEIQDPAITLDELTWRYFDVGTRQPELQRLFIREMLDADPAQTEYEPDGEDNLDMRRRQQAGEIAAELDPGFVLLILQAAVIAGFAFPSEAKRLMGVEPGSPEFSERLGEQLRRLVRRLGDGTTQEG